MSTAYLFDDGVLCESCYVGLEDHLELFLEGTREARDSERCMECGNRIAARDDPEPVVVARTAALVGHVRRFRLTTVDDTPVAHFALDAIERWPWMATFSVMVQGQLAIDLASALERGRLLIAAAGTVTEYRFDAPDSEHDWSHFRIEAVEAVTER